MSDTETKTEETQDAAYSNENLIRQVSVPVPAATSTPGPGKVRSYSVSLQENTLDFIESQILGLAENRGPCRYCNSTDLQIGHRCTERVRTRSESLQALDSNVCSKVAEKQPAAVSPSTRSRNLVGSEDETFVSNSVSNGRSHGNSPDHCHSNKILKPDLKARRKLILASFLCLLFMVGEAVGGYLANSLAIATDAAHLLTDFASFMISLFSLYVATRPPTKRMSFGWYRAEVIGALISVIMIWVVTGILVYMAAQRIVNKEFEIDAKIMLVTSAVGVAVNIVMGLTLHQHGHSHGGMSHGHSHGPESAADAERQPLLRDSSHSQSHSHSHGTGEQNINVRAAFIHVIGDLLQSVGVFVAAIVIYYKPDWVIIDPICTFLFSVLVLLTTLAIMKDTITVLMEGLPKGLDFNEVQNTFLQVKGVVTVHNLRIWALSLDKIALAAHLAVLPEVSTQEILLEASKLIRSRYNFFEMTLQIEEFNPAMEDCTQCQSPEC